MSCRLSAAGKTWLVYEVRNCALWITDGEELPVMLVTNLAMAVTNNYVYTKLKSLLINPCPQV